MVRESSHGRTDRKVKSMDLRTGQTYPTKAAAISAGVPASDIAEVIAGNDSVPEVRFSSGPFKGRVYKRTSTGQLVRVDNLERRQERRELRQEKHSR